MELTYVERARACACSCSRTRAVRECPRVPVCVRVGPYMFVCVRECPNVLACVRHDKFTDTVSNTHVMLTKQNKRKQNKTKKNEKNKTDKTDLDSHTQNKIKNVYRCYVYQKNTRSLQTRQVHRHGEFTDTTSLQTWGVYRHDNFRDTADTTS